MYVYYYHLILTWFNSRNLLSKYTYLIINFYFQNSIFSFVFFLIKLNCVFLFNQNRGPIVVFLKTYLYLILFISQDPFVQKAHWIIRLNYCFSNPNNCIYGKWTKNPNAQINAKNQKVIILSSMSICTNCK